MGGKINSLNEFAVKMNTAGKGFTTELEKAIAKATLKVQADARAKIGTYQKASGPFNAWQVLNPKTLKQKWEAGATNDDPLIGHYPKGKSNQVWPVSLLMSIQYELRGLTGVVGTNDPLGPWHEFGTVGKEGQHIPPRPYLRPALYENREWIKQACKDAIARALSTY